MDMLKNPIVLALIAGILTYTVMWWMAQDKQNKKKRKGKKGKKDRKESGKMNETNILIAVAVTLATWFVASSYLDDGSSLESQSNGTNSSGLELNNVNQAGSDAPHNNINSVSSEDATRSYNYLNSGLGIPQRKLPSVLIDTM